MKYRIINIKTGALKPKTAILIIYSGGTIGMVGDSSGSLVALKFNQIMQQLPSLNTLNVKITVISFPVPMDSSNMTYQNWIDIGYIIYENYHNYDGFVVLQGTDTMAYSASALSFILEGLNKPVVFIGAQLPISAIRSDARPNLITAIEIAAKKNGDDPVVPEVSIYFDYQLLRGNRAMKIRSSQFGAFESENYPLLARIGISIDFNYPVIRKCVRDQQLVFHETYDPNVVIIKLFPSITRQAVEHILEIQGLKGVVMETYGSGNAPTDEWFIGTLQKAISRGIIILNVSQCIGGKVIHGRYATSKLLQDIGVISGWNITTEAAITKLMFVLGQTTDKEKIKDLLSSSLSGEMDISA
ncbi:MAG: asparaginase [Cyclobacteriaceae bacterium]|nr:asparaginase [Cyclobacteriaceae bacterium]